jgi:hypothetical protein
MSIVRTILTSTLLFTCATTAIGQFQPPAVSRSAPVRVSPSPGVFAYQYGTPNLSFIWTQSPAFGFAGQLPTHFLFCLTRIREPNCSHATAVANLLPSQIPRTMVLSPFTRQPIATRYTHTPTIPDTKLDYIVAWQVLGCTSNADSSCLPASHAWMVAATVDLDALNVSPFISGDTYEVTATGTNVGSRSLSSHPSQAHNEVWIRTALLDSSGTLCRTNPNDPDIREETTLYVIDGYGRMTRFENLPRDADDRYIVSDVRAIYREGDAYDRSETLSLDIAPAQSQSAGTVSITVPMSMRPRALVGGVTMDSRNVIPEPNETDNGHAECEVFH